jgi:putative FmdB family regulatory protein
MPIYEYRCTSCHTELEKLQKISDPPLVECPECGKATLVKLISASSFRLKGSGWYETDFKTGKKKNGAAEESAGTPAAESGSAATDAGDKAVTKDIASKSATESNSKKEPSTPSKGETKTSAEAKPSAGSSANQAKSS